MTQTRVEAPGALPAHGWRNQLPFAAAMGLLVLCTLRHSGFMVLLAAPFVGIWISCSAVVAVRRPARRRTQAVKTAVLLLVLSAVATAHWWYARDARAQAQGWADAALAFKARMGRFPERAQELGVDEALARKKWKLAYSIASGEPQLMYAATFIPFDIYQFDFHLRAWVYRPS